MKKFYSQITKFKIARFTISGTISAMVDLALLYMFTDIAGVWYVASAIIAFIISATANFCMQKFWSFRAGETDFLHKQIFFFSLLGVLNVIINAVLLYFFVEQFKLWYMFSQVIIILILGVVNFVAYSLIFRRIKQKISKRKRKILIAAGLYPPDVGGPATYARELEDSLPLYGFEVSVVPFGSVRRFPPVIRHLLYLLLLVEYGEDAHIIFALDPVSVGLPALVAAKLFGKKFVVKVVGDYAWEQFQQEERGKRKEERFVTLEEFQKLKYGFKTELLRWIERHVARSAEVVVVPSGYLKGIMLLWGVPEERLKVIYNGLTHVEISGSEEKLKRIKERFNARGKILISIGRLVPWKGFGALIELMPRLLEEVPDLKLIILGDGPERRNLESKINDLKLESDVFLIGDVPRSAVYDYIKVAHAFALYTSYEGFSHVLLEAMMGGLPVVTTTAGGNTELIENGKTGILVNIGDREALFKGVVEVLKTPRGEELAQNAEKKVKEFSVSRMIKETVSLLQNI